MVHWDVPARWVNDKQKSRRTQRIQKPRVIGMGAEVATVLRERAEKFGTKRHVFLNEDGRLWTCNSLGLRIRRLRERAGISPNEKGEKLVLYSNRHTFLTAAGKAPTRFAGDADGAGRPLRTADHRPLGMSGKVISQ